MLAPQSERAAIGSVSGLRPSVPVAVCTAKQQDVPIYRYGIEVRAGDILARIDARPYQAALRQAQANLKRDQARLSSASPELQRRLELERKGASSQKSVEVQKATIEQLQADIEAEEALLDKATIDLDYYMVIRAPIDGRIGLRSVDKGNYVLALETSTIATINQVTPIGITFTLPDVHLLVVTEQIATGRTLAVSALSRDNRVELELGTLLTIDNQIDSKTGTFKLNAAFDNTRERLWPGQFVNARLHLDVYRGGTVIPAQAVQRGPNGPYVFAVTENDTAQMRAVTPTQIESGVALISAPAAKPRVGKSISTISRFGDRSST
jgi:multidrug efflux system membrane fusion protein